MSWINFNRRTRITETRIGNAVFLAKHPILAQITQDLVDGLSSDLVLEKKVIIYCGIHKRYHLNYFRRGYKIGIQTEQFLNAEGETLWGQKYFHKMMSSFKHFDTVLEINPSNKPAYSNLDWEKARKIIYGAHIFPASAPSYSGGDKESLAFVGAIAGRREKVLDSLIKTQKITIIDEGIYGEELNAALDTFSALINIHVDSGTYTEFPRLLTALKAGKPLVSEPLCPALIAGTHYALVDNEAHLKRLESIYENFKAYVLQELCFEKLLLKLKVATKP